MITPRIRACQRLHISQGTSVTLLGLVWLKLRLVDEVDTVNERFVAFGIGWRLRREWLVYMERDDLSLGWEAASMGKYMEKKI